MVKPPKKPGIGIIIGVGKPKSGGTLDDDLPPMRDPDNDGDEDIGPEGDTGNDGDEGGDPGQSCGNCDYYRKEMCRLNPKSEPKPRGGWCSHWAPESEGKNGGGAPEGRPGMPPGANREAYQ